ncbi:UNVERIFIED_CONTAM: hypothetical protein FKN15_037528 [Acipenser sinensis]
MKRGIITALMAPMESDENIKTIPMDTVYGKCDSELTVNTRKADTSATDITVTRDLVKCQSFDPMRGYVSPLALITGMNTPLSTLISSSQSCKYVLDSKRRHVTDATCTEKHVFLPFSQNEEYGIMSQVKQTLTFVNVVKTNNRYFDQDESAAKPLAMDYAEDKSPIQTKEAVLEALRALQELPGTQQGQQRASLFHKLVNELRHLNNKTLGEMVHEMAKISSSITLQALPQCGTPECISAVLQVLRLIKAPTPVVDAVTYSLGLLPSPCHKRVRETLTMAQYQQSRATLYALSHTVRKFYDMEDLVTPEVTDVSQFMASLLGSDCSGNEDHIYLTLKAIGNMGKAMEDANPDLKSTVLKCVQQPSASLAVQQAAIQAFRQMTITDEVRSILLRVFQENSGKVQKRVAAYLMLMKKPSQSDLSKVIKALLKEKNESQVKSFVASHIANILESEEPSVQDLKRKVEEALKGNQLPDAMDFRKFSRNYHVSHTIPDNIFGFEPLTTTVGGNMIFDPTGYMPREAMLQTTLQAFGNTIDMFEFGLDGNGFEPSLDALFGEKGFFPDSALKAMYWVNNKLPESINEVLKNWFGHNKDGKAKREIPEDIIKEITYNAKKLMKDLKSQDSPEAAAYLRILGAELGYLKTSDFKTVAEMIMNFGKELQGLPIQVVKAVTSGTDMDLFAHYIFMDNEFSLPTGAGLPLKFSLSGVFTPGARAGLKIDPKTKQLTFRPSLAVEFITQMGVQIPEFTTNGIQMHTNIYHESGVNAKVSIKGQQVKLSIPAPQGPTQLFSISNKLLSVSSGQTDIVPPNVESRTNTITCNPMFPGLQYCTTVRYSKASMTDAAPYYPLTGETRFYDMEDLVTPEVTDVAQFMASLLGSDCSGNEDHIYLTLKAIGNMGKAMEDANPDLKSTVLKCVQQPSASLAVQQAAIQAFRQMTITDEVRSILLRVFQENSGKVQKRVAAYLMLMKKPSQSDLSKVIKALLKEKNESQVKSFVASHIANILESEEPSVQDLKRKVEEALKGNQLPDAMDFRKFSRNYHVSHTIPDNIFGFEPLTTTVGGNMIFDPTGYMPREAMLQTTLQAFGNTIDMFEDSPEAAAYLRILGAELGYLKTSDFKTVAEMIMNFGKELQGLPIQVVKAVTSGTDMDLFAHYIFMDNEFSLPTGAGLPLKFSLSGVFTPGARAGLKIDPKTAIGNMGKAMEDANPDLKSTVLKCVQQPSASLAVQQAAIQAFRQMTITDEVRSILLRVFQENSGKVQKRVAAYLMLMKKPSQSDLSKVIKALLKEKNESQVKSFVASHIANILESEEPSVQDLKRKVEEALKGNQLPDAMDFRKFSRNYHVSHTIPDNIFGFEPLTTTVGGNMIFDPTGYMPREAMLQTTLQAFGNTIDMFEFGLDGNGFEPSLDALFGEKGFFPDSALKAMYWVNNKLPESINEVLKNWFGHNKDGKAKREIPEDIIKEITYNAKKLMKDLKSQDSPEAAAYLRILGAELGYLKTSDFKTVAEMIMNFGKELQGLPIQVVKAVTSGTDMDLFAHYIFMDNEFSLPTGAGFPLKFSLSGVFTPGAKAGLKIDPKTIPEDIIKEITYNAKKLMKDLKSQDSPEAAAYLRILGAELGYLKTSDFKTVAEMIMNFGKELQGLPIQVVKAVTSGTDMDLFAHYIFMDNEFSLPTGAGLPLKFSLSGVFTPGARAGLKIDPKTKQLTFRPSLAVEFITQMGVQIPEFTTNGIQMHTNIYHESGVNAKVSIKGQQVKLSIPAPQGPTQLFSISNTLLSLSTGQSDIVPPIVESRTNTITCNPMFPGLQYCTTVRYSKASMTDAAPYYPLTGETRFAFEIQPTGEVTEYSATIAYELLKEDRDKVDTVKLTVQAEGSQGSEAMATMKYNRNKMTISSDLQIPDYDVQVGINVGVKDEGMFKGKKTYGLNIGVSNKNVPELALLGRVRFEGMKEGQISVQLTIPRINVDGKTIATVNVDNGLTVQLDATANIPESSSTQRVIFRYDNNKAELEMKSDIHADLKKLLPDFSHYQNSIQKYTDDILDQKVAKTDMKLRHIVSKSIEAGNIWLNKIAKDLPYVENLRNKQSLPELTLPSIPEKLYLKTDSLIRYQFNKNKLIFEVDLPLGGKTSQELNFPNTFYTPPLVFPEVGINVPSKEFSIPSFTIPKTQEIRLPLLGVAELSATLTSNYYNWTASFIGGNNTQDNVPVTRFIAKYQVKAEAPVDLLSYNVEGTGLMTSDAHGVVTTSVNGSLQHSLLEASVSYSDYANFEDLSSRANYHFGASSVFGVTTSLSYSLQSKVNEIGFKLEDTLGGYLAVGPLYGNYTSSTTYSFNKDQLERRVQSSTKLDSSFLEATNRITGSYVNAVLSIISYTDVHSGALVHVGEISYKDGVLNLKSDANGRHKSISALNKIEISLSGQLATMRVESQAQHLRNRVFALISGSLNGRGLELNADGTINVAESRGAHKATLTINPNGLATSATTSLQCSAVIFSNVFNGGIDTSGATLSLVTKGSDIKNTAELTVDGKVGSSEVSLNSVYKGNIMDANSRNRLNFKVNKEGLAFSNNMMGSYNKIKAEHTNTLNIALWSLAFSSKTDNLLGAGNSYKHDFKFDLKPFIISLSLNNDLKFLGVDFTNEGKLKLEPFHISLNGNMRGAYGKDQELKHTYTINYAELAGTVECSTTGRVWGAQVDNAVKLEVAALSSKFHSDTKLSCKSLRFDNVVRTLVKPFKVSVEAVTNGDGSLNLYGTHSGQMYSKFLMKAEPLAVTYLHDYRGSTTHHLETGGPASTLLDNKLNGLVTPSEQSSTWKLKTQLNKNTYTQDVIAYNKAEKIGIELAGHILTDILPIFASSGRSARDVSGQLQEFSISGFLKYDKNKDLHIIELPFVESLPAVIEQIKANMVNALESLQRYLKSLKLNDLVRKYKASLDRLPQQVNDYVKRLELESKINNVKKQLMAFTNDYTVTVEDLERYLERVKELCQEALTDLQEQLNKLEMKLKAYDPIEWKQAIEKLISTIVKTLKTIDQQYEITRTAMSTISVMQDIIQKYDLNKLKDSSTAWLQNLDEKYQIKAELQKALDKLKELIQSFDVQKIAEDLLDRIKSVNIEDAINTLKTSFPTNEISRVMETIKDVVLNWIEEYEVTEKINSAYAKLQELLVKYEIDKKVQVLMDKAALLVQQYKVKETVQSAVNVLKSIDVKSYVDTMQHSLDDVIKLLKAQNYKQIIEQLNAYIDMLLQKIKSFDYNTFVDETNKNIADMTKYVNAQIKDLEIPQKIESARQYIKDVQIAAMSYLKQLKNTRLAEVMTWVKDLMDSTALNEVRKRIQDNLEDLRNRISTMDIQKEVKLYLQRASDFYNRFVNFMIDQWNNAYKNISTLAEQYDIKNAVDRLKKAIEEGVAFPESIIGTVRIPAFELSLNALKKAEFETPEFTIPLTDLHVPSVKINLKKLQEISIPTRYTEVSTPGFTVPMIGFSMPSYTLVLPSLELPVLHVPATLQKLTLPKFKVPRTQDTILVPAMGNITYDFAFKSAVITLNANAGIYNQSDITARFSAVASSVFDVLSFKLDGTTSLTRQRGLKLATALSLSHQNIEGAHDSTLSLTKRFIDASVTTTSKVKLPGINLEFKQELKGNSKSKPNVASKMNLKYNFKVPQIDTNGKGTVDHTLTLEGLTSYFSLDTTTKGNIEGIFLTTNTFSGKINNEASTYLNSNGIRSTIKTNANSKVDSKKSKIWNFDLNENLALEASPLRLYTMWNHTGSNEAIISRFNTKGNQAAKAILELVPTSMKADLQLVVSQPSSLVEEASIHHTVAVNINSENQKLGWNGKQQFMSKILAHDFLLSNDDSEVRFDVTGSMQGHVTFLKDITLPIYEKNIWELLRFDLTTSEDKLQYLNGSTTIVYTKNKDGYFFPLPINVLADGVTINIPEVTLQIPKWLKNLPRKIQEIDIPIGNFKIPERVSIPSVIVTPVFKVPLTSIQVPSYTIDFKKIKIPKKISSLSFDLTLPHLPKVKFPKVDIAVQYLNAVKSKLPQFSVAVPDFKIIISSFTLPKTFTVGSHVIEMDKVVNQIANFDLPTITIPEQKIEIPEISVSLPAGLFIPVFGALSTTVKVASPIYNMSWTTSLENKTSSMVSSVKSTCSSTMVFLEYDLEASATTSYQDGAFKLDGKCTLSHNDLSIEWRHAYNLNNQRPKHHLLNVDITSPTFADVSIRYAAGMDVITASVSSPSAGFLGLLLEKTGPERIHGKLYSRYPSSPENDVDLLDAVVSVKNPEQLHVEAFWNHDGPYFMLEGLNQRIPKMVSAVYSCINKYHRQHFGMDINRLSLMLKDNIQNYIETVYRETSKKIDELGRGLHNMVKYASLKYDQMKDKTKIIYKRAADNMAKVDLQDLSSKFYDASIDLIREYQKKINDLLDATIKFLRVTKFQLPGFNHRHTGQELFNKAADSASVIIDKFLQQVKNVLQHYTDALIKYINDMEIKIPGSDKILQGKDVLDSIKDYLRKVQNEVVEAVKSLQKVNLEKSLQKLKDFFQTSFMQVEEVIKALKTKKLEEIKVQVQGMYNDAINSPLTAQIKYALDHVVDSVTRFYEFTQTCLKYIVEELEKTSHYVKSLREEYLDANMVGWTVKYYEIEEKMIELVKSCAEYVKENGPKYIEQVIAYVTQFTELVGKQGTEYLNYAKDLLTDADGRGMKMISELSNKAQAQIHEWSTLAKNVATEYRDHAQVKLQEAYGNLSLDKLTSEVKRLFDIIMQQYSAYYQAILEILKELKNNIQPYIQYRDEKLQLDVPLPFLWESFDELPHPRSRYIKPDNPGAKC